ncbi:UDP-glucosyltransferase B1 [Apiospora saccharicola]|uniref:UDP-glucosyltransferase B1 n=1 Tax=Apiospora saccharicola TaxID=335842 RepID=A0ABR1W680_9PEZI
MSAPGKPLVVLTCTPGQGHTNPIKTLAKALTLAGYEVTVVSSSHYQKHFEDAGCSYVAIQGYGDYWDGDRETKWPERASIPPGPDQFAWTIEHSFVRVIPDQHAAVQKAIKGLRETHPGRAVVLLNESAFLGSLPLMKGAGEVKPDGTIGIGINPISLNSVDTAPFGLGLPPPKSAAESAQYAEMRKGVEHLYLAKPQAVFNDIAKDLGAETDGTVCSDAPYLWPDRFLQLCASSIMYPRSDAPDSVRFTGGLPRLPRPTEAASLDRPAWWNEVVANPAGKDIVFVCQGTVLMNYDDLITPTLEALKDRPNTLVIAALGQRGATLDSSINVPENVRVVDYVSFDDILPHCSVFVGTGGYGGIQHSVSHGTPMVVAGVTEDKTEMCAICEWAGVAVNLRTGKPTSEALRAGIDKVLSDPTYKNACVRIQAEMAASDPIKIIMKNIEEVVQLSRVR